MKFLLLEVFEPIFWTWKEDYMASACTMHKSLLAVWLLYWWYWPASRIMLCWRRMILTDKLPQILHSINITRLWLWMTKCQNLYQSQAKDDSALNFTILKVSFTLRVKLYTFSVSFEFRWKICVNWTHIFEEGKFMKEIIQLLQIAFLNDMIAVPNCNATVLLQIHKIKTGQFGI